MGIDIWGKWKVQTEADFEAAIQEDTGYLWESYHGEPYATRFLVSEAFESPDATAKIPASVLRERLPETLRLVEQREREVYEETNPQEIEAVKENFSDFIELCERKEQETGEPVTIIANY